MTIIVSSVPIYDIAQHYAHLKIYMLEIGILMHKKESLWKSAVKNFTGSASNPEWHQQPPLTLPSLPDVHYNMKSSNVILCCLEYNSITFCA